MPMMYMDDAIDATLALMEAELREEYVSYNLAAISFSPEELAAAIRSHIPEFSIRYAPDARQLIADSWPRSIDDAKARQDWGWQPKVDLDDMVRIMLQGLHYLT